jgi:hypothetical protein
MRGSLPFRVLALAGAAIALLASKPASADVEKWIHERGGGEMVFKDDPLHSGVGLPFGDNLTVRPVPYRLMLIRPRTEYIAEMLKSVEKI